MMAGALLDGLIDKAHETRTALLGKYAYQLAFNGGRLKYIDSGTKMITCGALFPDGSVMYLDMINTQNKTLDAAAYDFHLTSTINAFGGVNKIRGIISDHDPVCVRVVETLVARYPQLVAAWCHGHGEKPLQCAFIYSKAAAARGKGGKGQGRRLCAGAVLSFFFKTLCLGPLTAWIVPLLPPSSLSLLPTPLPKMYRAAPRRQGPRQGSADSRQYV